MKPGCLSLIHIYGPVVMVQCPKTIRSLSYFRFRIGSAVEKIKYTLSAFLKVTNITRACTVATAQYPKARATTLICCVQPKPHNILVQLDRTPIAQFSKRSEDPSWHNGHNRPILPNSVRCQLRLCLPGHICNVKLP